VVGAAAYFVGGRQNQRLGPALRDAKAAADPNQRASAAEAQVAQLQKQLDEIQKALGSANAQVSQLNLQVSLLTQDADKKQKQIKQDQTKISELIQNANDLRANAAKDQDQIKRMELRNPPDHAGLSLAKLRSPQSGPFISDRPRESGASDSCEFISLARASELVRQSQSAGHSRGRIVQAAAR
jgi:hypothetical protein